MQFAMRASLLLLLVACTPGCNVMERGSSGRSPLRPLTGAPDMATLEIFTAPMPLGDPRLAALWSEVDEQALPADLRRRLKQNGLRVGIVGPRVDDVLAEVLNVTDRPIPAEERGRVPLDAEPGTTLRIRQFQYRKRSELAVSPVHDQISLLRSLNGEVEGRTYTKAEGRFDLRVYAEPDARIRLELRPQLHHGEFKQRFSGSEGVFRMEPLRTIQSYDDLKLSATLGPGQMLLLTCEPDHPGSIGHCFFAQAGGDKPIQKLWVIRASQAGPDRMFYEGPKADDEPSSDEGE